MKKYIIFFCLLAADTFAGEIIGSIATKNNATTIFAESEQPNGTFNKILLEQPQNAPNPLGDPIYYTPSSSSQIFIPQKSEPIIPQTIPPKNVLSEISPQNPSISQISPQAVNAEIQNKLYQSGNRIYDVQSYPINDINYINQNNQDNAITNYPAY